MRPPMRTSSGELPQTARSGAVLHGAKPVSERDQVAVPFLKPVPWSTVVVSLTVQMSSGPLPQIAYSVLTTPDGVFTHDLPS